MQENDKMQETLSFQVKATFQKQKAIVRWKWRKERVFILVHHSWRKTEEKQPWQILLSEIEMIKPRGDDRTI